MFLFFKNCVVQSWIFTWCSTWTALLPTLACFIIHLLIFIHVRSSSRRTRKAVFSLQRNLIGKRRRDSNALRQVSIIYCTFLLGCGPIGLLFAIDDHRRADPSIYASLQAVGSLSSLIIVIYLISINNDVKDYLRQINRSRLRQETAIPS